MAEEDDELLGMFVQEATEHLETIEPDLLTLEERGDSDGTVLVVRGEKREIEALRGRIDEVRGNR